MPDFSRELSVFADGGEVTGFSHVRLTGRDCIGLFPMPFTLRLWNLPDSGMQQLAAAKEITVLREDSILAAGQTADVCRMTGSEGAVTEVVFSAGLRLWEVPVSLSVEAGVSVSETVRRILEASGTGIPLLAFPGENPVRTRGQAFFGRAAECIASALSGTGARGCLVPSGLCVIPSSGSPESVTLTEADLTDAPVRTGEKLMILRTRVTGWPLGKTVSVRWNGESAEGLVIERSVDAENMEGSWLCELLIEVRM